MSRVWWTVGLPHSRDCIAGVVLSLSLSLTPGPSSSYERVESLPREEEEEEEGGEVSSYRLSCPWKYTATGRLLSVVGVGLVVVAVVACCCSGFLSDEAEEEGTKRREVSVLLRPEA